MATLVYGCAVTQSAGQIQQPFDQTKPRIVRIEPCVDRTGLTSTRGLAAEATLALNEKVSDSHVFTITNDAYLVLTCNIERFAKGSTLKRWVVPGWGKTEATIAVII